MCSDGADTVGDAIDAATAVPAAIGNPESGVLGIGWF